ncbi:MAG TPA: GGDEF domain-containing protein [Symbiobacteriaceae bacterium]|nr:GGDEF domain-containing protein [Symbiobacteriaceae bacterium]
MRSKHPWQALAFIYLVDAIAAGLLLWQRPFLAGFAPMQWVSAVAFACAMAASRVMLVQGVDNRDINYGWYMAVEFAVIVSMPVPLSCLIHLPAIGVEIIHRLRRGEPEPFLGPDYNAAASIICAFVGGHALQWLLAQTPGTDLWMTLALLPVALLFVVTQYVLLGTLVCLDQRMPLRGTGLLHPDGYVPDLIMTLLGALIGRLYVLDRSTILLTIMPLALLQHALRRIQQAKLAHIDPKTGLHNYRYLDGALNEEVRKATQTGRPLALIFGDMDYLRDINNTYGHLAGDRALVAVASIFRRHASPGHVAARFGGEEFVLLMPGVEKEEARQVAEGIRRDTAAERLENDDGGPFSVTISLGVASFPEDATTIQGLIKAADEAVYAAKHGGKNRVCAYATGLAI